MIERDGETLSTPLDKRAQGGKGFPGEGYRRRVGGKPGRAILWDATEAETFEPEAVWGAYPQRFVQWACRAIGCPAHKILHVCSGALGPDVGGLRVDLRAAAEPDVMADGCALPFRDEAFAGVLLDPPYSVEYAETLYGTGYPRPSHLLAEAARVVRPGGRVGFLHFLVPKPGSELLSIERIWGVTQGCGYRIRAFTVLRRRAVGLFDAALPAGPVWGEAQSNPEGT